MKKINILVLFFLVISFLSCQENEEPIAVEEDVEDVKFEKPKVYDIDGNEYNVDLVAGRQWMVENLKTSRYNNGDLIPNVTDPKEWSELESGAFAWFDNDPKNEEKLGKLYNWYAVSCCPICPKGWRIPTKQEFDEVLSHYQSRFWFYNSSKKENEITWSDFNSMGAERRNKEGKFHQVLNYDGSQSLVFTGFWSSETYNENESFIVYAYAPRNRLISAKLELSIQPKKTGISVKCIKDL